MAHGMIERIESIESNESFDSFSHTRVQVHLLSCTSHELSVGIGFKAPARVERFQFFSILKDSEWYIKW